MFESVRVGSGRSRAKVLVVGRFHESGLDQQTKGRDAGIAEAAKRPEGSGKLGSIAEVFPSGKSGFERVMLVGLGAKGEFGLAALRSASAAVAKRLASIKATSVEIDFAGPIKSAKLDRAGAGRAVGEAFGLCAWSCDTFRGSATPDPERAKLTIKASGAGFVDGIERGLGLAESANIARTLSQTPPNIATPAYIASEARKMARKTGLSCRVIQGKQLETEHLTGLINVGKASENAPCLVRLEYKPKRSGRASKPIVLIGKTMTYDSGGLSIKVGGGMKGMKRDKDGGCAVFGAMHAIATVVKPDRPVVGLLMCAENSISDEAYRPDDVLEFRNGVTVEVTNTDAEGRLVLADGLCWAGDEEDPACIVDLATLTGGIVVALGPTYAGMWCDDDKLRSNLEAAAEASGERVWRMPLHREYREMMRSPVADIVNSAPVRAAHPIQGAAFLSHFAPEGVPWAHIDIAGTHAVDKETGPYIAGPTGYGVRLVAEMVGRM